jgi:hypothetical protein
VSSAGRRQQAHTHALARPRGWNIVSLGRARWTSYAVRRESRGRAAALPLYAIDETGRGSELGALDLVHPEGSALTLKGDFPWPLAGEVRDGWFDGLPFPLLDSRPQGFLGRIKAIKLLMLATG